MNGRRLPHHPGAGTIPGVNLTTVLSTPPDRLDWLTLSKYLTTFGRTLPRTRACTIHAGDPATAHTLVFNANWSGNPRYELAEPVRIDGVALSAVTVFAYHVAIGHGFPTQLATQIREAVEIAWSQPPADQTRAGLRHLICVQDLRQSISFAPTITDRTERQAFYDSEVRDGLIQAALTAPGLTDEQAQVAAALAQGWAGTGAELLDTVARLTGTTITLTS